MALGYSAFLLLALPAAAQEIERFEADGSPEQTFALFVPPDYSAERTWPILFVLDPRGQALPTLRHFRRAAERLGYFVASSYGTASDVGDDPNTPALNAMISTVQARYRLDTRRFYLVGMSGTARYAWAAGYAAGQHVAGIAGFAAGLPPDMDLEAAVSDHGSPFVFFGGVGDSDYNHPEMVLFARQLEGLNYPHRLAWYPGPHGWPRSDHVFTRAVEWFHLQAMRRGLIDTDAGWIRELLERWLSEADALEADDELAAAWLGYRSIVNDFEGLTDVSGAERRRDRLGRRPDVQRWQAERTSLAEAHFRYQERTTQWLEEAESGNPSLAEARRALALDSLVELAGASDSLQSAAASRALSDLYSWTSFYLARDYMRHEDWLRARLALGIANSIFPGRGRVCEQLAIVSRALRERMTAEGCPAD